jgi:hypothetical protein
MITQIIKKSTLPLFKTMIKADTNSHKLTNIQLEIKELREVQNGK